MRPVKRKGVMNKTEAAYAARLELLKLGGEIIHWEYEGVTFKLADRTTYTPDFFVVCRDRFEFHEVKGRLLADGSTKFKVAAEMHPWFKWYMVRKAGAAWKIIKEV